MGSVSMAATKSVKASDRTIDMFTGATNVEKLAAAAEEIQAEQREPFTGIEGEVDRWREQAFAGQEWTSKHFYQSNAEANQKDSSHGAYRISLKGGWNYMECIRRSETGTSAYHYSGLMFPALDMFAIAEAVVKQAWSTDKEATRELFKRICK